MFQQVEALRPVGFVVHGEIRGGVHFGGLRGIYCQGIELARDHFGAEVLLRGEHGETEEVFLLHAVLDAIERLFNAPAGTMEVGEIDGRIGRRACGSADAAGKAKR